jgi:ABC-type branched-subunit amino acid transport system ATPase component
LIGPNGAGKTSVINLLAGVTALDEGEISLGGERLDKEPAYRVARHGIVRTFQACRLFPELSVFENVKMAAEAARPRSGRKDLSNKATARAALAMVECSDLVSRQAGVLSYADQRRVEIARALATGPAYLLLDEPAAGMVESEAAQLADVVRKIAQAGVGVLVIDHNVNWIFSLCDHVYVQNLGALIASGAPGEVRNDPAVIEAYIGAPRGEAHVAG